MSILIVDFESTGVDTKTARITEVGAMRVDNYWVPVGDQGLSQLVWASNYPALTPEVEAITGISQAMLLKDGVRPAEALVELALLCDAQTQFILAYNRAYDENLWREELQRHDMFGDPRIQNMMRVPWICAMEDVESNYKKKCWKLSHITLDYGVAVDPSKLHRAMGDVELTRRMLTAAGATPTAMYQFQLSPWVFVKAIVKKPWDDGGKSTDEAKKLGYRWERANGTDRKFDKTWVKRIKQHDWEEEQTRTPFKVEII